MDKLIHYIQNYSMLNSSTEQLILDNIYTERFVPKSFIHEAGTVCKRIGFIKFGIIRSYFYDTKGNEIINNFHIESQFAIDVLSYQIKKASNLYLQAITECEIIFVPKSLDEYLVENIREWPILVRKITDAILAEKIENKTVLLHEDAKTRYLSFLSKNPKLINMVPLGQVASYLGIAQQSLSRIRKELIA